MAKEEFPKYFNEHIETMPWHKVVKDIQEPRFLKQLDYLFKNSVFYQRKFKEAGLKRGDIRRIEDMHKIPFTEKHEIRHSQEEAPPLGTHTACKNDKVFRMYSSSGTTGRPTYIGLTKHDLRDVWQKIISRTYYCAGVRPNDKLVFTIQVGPFVAGATLQGFEIIGTTTIPLGPGQTERLILSYQVLGANIFMGTPSYAEHLIGWCRERGIDTHTLGIKKIIVAGEPGGSIPSVRNKIETAYNGTCIEAMGIADVAPSLWAECPEAKQGMHFCGHEFAMVELIDPETGTNIEWKDGAEGELVYSAIDRQCNPLMRFRSRDRVQVWTSPCICGRTSPRVRVIGRTDDMLIVRGVNVFPSAVKSVVSEFVPRTTGHVEIQLKEPGPGVTPPMAIKVEYGAEPGDLKGLKKDLETILRAKLIFQADVDLVPEGTLPRYEYKGKLVKKLYEQK